MVEEGILDRFDIAKSLCAAQCGLALKKGGFYNRPTARMMAAVDEFHHSNQRLGRHGATHI